MMKPFSILSVTPMGLTDPSLAIAASRTGEIGILDLEYSNDEPTAIAAIALLQRHGKPGHFGIKINCSQHSLIARILAEAQPYSQTVILSYDQASQLDEPLLRFKKQNFRVLLETTSAKDIRLAETLGVDGLIAKGNEAGGRVGEEMTFVLLQSLLVNSALPVYAQGGVGLHTAAACYVAGAAGVVLDGQILLAGESPLTQATQDRIRRMDGSETLCLGSELGAAYRFFVEPGTTILNELNLLLEELLASAEELAVKQLRWHNAIAARFGWSSPRQQLLLLGQDVSFATSFGGKKRPLADIFTQIQSAIHSHSQIAAQRHALAEGARLAQLHGTRYPIVQGPMTRVSDSVAFALAVAQGGGLPFIALALMQQKEAAELLQTVELQLAGHSWGVGMLGFVSQELRQQQLAVIQRYRPNYVIIAGGRPDQALELEQAGIPTYLHVPSPSLLQIFLADGAKRFIFEGRECGGHVGPRSSFVLWNSVVDVLVAHLQKIDHATDRSPGDEYSVLFAGGIHDGLSAAMVSAISAPLSELGVRVGVLMGTAYLFTHEAVTAGAILPRYQQEAQQSVGTVLVESGLGHVTRCLPTPFVDVFKARRSELQKSGLDADSIRNELENLNVGRLRIASKGIVRYHNRNEAADAPRYMSLNEEEQFSQGMYMIGQVAGLRDDICSIEELHAEVVAGSADYLATAVERAEDELSSADEKISSPSQIAIVGMACILPGAAGLDEYWQNILNRVDTITEIPRERFDWRLYFDPDRNAKDKIYSRWGGFIGDVPFDPLSYGMPPNSIPAIEPMQLLMLEVVRAALADAGYTDRPFAREETSVIMAVGGGLGDRGFHYSFRTYLPHFLDADVSLAKRLNEQLPEWTEDSFPGMLLNVLAGRVANRFDLGGANFVVDAACGSSLAALDIAVKDLELGRTKMAIVGAADTVQSPFGFMAFSKTQALSPTGRCRPLDVNADGIAISEGLAVVILKRLEDAKRDGDTVYAVIQGVGSSSDGRDRSLTAPRPEGQLRALRRAYKKANFSPTSVDLFEAHGTGTKLGDSVEIDALQTLLVEAASRQTPSQQSQGIGSALGSVKSMIGHTKSTAGLAGLIKTVLGLHHKVMPPTLVEKPNLNLLRPESAVYVNNTVRPWVRQGKEATRRAGVSAFGFGGTNFHVALEEYQGDYRSPQLGLAEWPVELMLFAAATSNALIEQLNRLASWLDDGNRPPLKDLAYTLYRRYRHHTDAASTSKAGWLTVAITTNSLDDLRQKLNQASAEVQSGKATKTLREVHFTPEPLATVGKVAFLFPGQGSQYPDMFRELMCAFPTLMEPLERANALLEAHLAHPLSSYIFPRPTFSDEAEAEALANLTNTAVAQPALGAVSLAASNLLAMAGVAPDFVGGHSYGELVALCQAGAFGIDDLFLLSATRGHLMAEAAGANAGTMVAVRGGSQEIAALVGDLTEVTLANLNAPNQTVLSGTADGIAEAVRRCDAAGYSARRLPVACAFHSPLVAAAQMQLSSYLEQIDFNPARITVFSNSLGEPYPQATDEMRALLSSQLARPVYFQKQVEVMYEMGARIFVEVGPRRVLSGLVGEILAGQAHSAVAIDGRAGGLATFVTALAQLAADGLALELDTFFDSRGVTRLNLDERYQDPAQARIKGTTWMVNGGRARPWRDKTSAAFEPIPAQLRQPPAPSDVAPPLPEHTQGNNGIQPRPTHATTFEAHTPSTPEHHNSLPQAESERTTPALVSDYHQMMSQFLATHSNIMQAYLADEPHEANGQVMNRAEVGPETDNPLASLDEPIIRYVITPMVTPLTGAAAELMVGGVVLVVGGEQEMANALISAMHEQGHRVVRLASSRQHVAEAHRNGQSHAHSPTYVADFTEVDQLRSVLAEIRSNHGALAGVIYLASQEDLPGEFMTYQRWQQSWQTEFVGLLHLIQQAHDDLVDAAEKGGACILAATSLGGCFDGSHRDMLATLQGGIAGLLKTLAHELVGVRVKVVDVDPDQPLPLRTHALCDEFIANDGIVEVGYLGASRCTLQLVPATSEGYRSPITLDAESVILITGGARGITAQVAESFAQAYQPKLILVGRSPLPEAESGQTSGLTSMSEIKALLLKQMQEAGGSVRLADVEKAYQRLMAERELRRNLEMLKQSGAEIYYQDADVRNEAEFGRLIEAIYAQFGRLDGVIHGAGVLEDKLLRDKQADSLRRVVSTKIDSAFLLSRYLRPDTLQFLVFFSSVSGRFGNRGQGDYAAANEVLNKLARQLDSRWPGRVFSVNWGPWDSVGMVSEELRKAFNQRGVALIPPHIGCDKLIEELHSGRKGAAEVLIAGVNIQAMQHLPAPRPLVSESTGRAIDTSARAS